MPQECFKVPAEALDVDVFLPQPKDLGPTTTDSPPKIFFSMDVNPTADGSAYLEYGDIKVYCSVDGPSEMRQDGQLVTSLKFAPFAHWLEKDQQNCIEKRLSQLLLSALESSVMLYCFPRGKYEIACLILEYGARRCGFVGSCLAGAVTCAGLALMNASVPMYDLPVGLNLNMSSFGDADGYLCAAILPQLHQFSMLYSSESHVRDDQCLKKTLNQALDSGVQLASTIKQILSDSVGSKT